MAEKCHLLGEYSRISGSKRSLAVCTTVVQLGILRLSERTTVKIGSCHSSIKDRLRSSVACVAFLIKKRLGPLLLSKISSQIFKTSVFNLQLIEN